MKLLSSPMLAPFPSKTIARYTAKMFLMRTGAFLAALVIILQTLDLLGESGKILAAPGNEEAELWRYVALRVPQLIAQFLPFSVLLATLVTLATLNQNSEVVIFKSTGISAHQILAPLIIAAAGVAVVNFLFNEFVLVRTNAQLEVWQEAEYGAMPATGEVNREVWVRAGGDLMHADSVTGIGASTTLVNFTLYDRTDDRLQFIITAKTARYAVPDRWVLTDVRRFDVARGVQMASASSTITSGAGPERFTTVAVDADRTPFWLLWSAIDALRAAGRPVDTLVAALHHKISGPLSAMLMPLLGSVAAFGLARSGRLFVRAVVGMALGFAFFVADNFMMAMGDFGAVPPILAAWSPFVLFILIGEAVLFRTEE
jgi:lipopolysaccharide export system permease protein